MHGEHEGGVEDGAVGADEASELAVGEHPEGIGRRGRRGRGGGEHEIVEAPLPLLRITRPAVAAEHAHAAFLAVAATAAGKRRSGDRDLAVVCPRPQPVSLSAWAFLGAIESGRICDCVELIC